MILIDVNVFVYAFDRDCSQHAEYRRWVEGVLNGEEPHHISDQILAAVVRISTHPKIFKRPSTLAEALEYVRMLRAQPNGVTVSPGERHWEIFMRLCQKADARGNLITDAWFAALAIESGSEWITADRDYARFPGLKWRHPFDQR